MRRIIKNKDYTEEEMQAFFDQFDKESLFEMLNDFADNHYETPSNFASRLKDDLLKPKIDDLLEADSEYQALKENPDGAKEEKIIKVAVESLRNDFGINYNLNGEVTDITAIQTDLESELVTIINATESKTRELLHLRSNTFKVGDEIIMNEYADGPYRQSKSGSKGKIVNKRRGGEFDVKFYWLTGKSRGHEKSNETFNISPKTMDLAKSLIDIAKEKGGPEVYAHELFESAHRDAIQNVNENVFDDLKNRIYTKVTTNFVNYLSGEEAIRFDSDDDYVPQRKEINRLLQKVGAFGLMVAKLKTLKEEILFSEDLYGSEDKAKEYWKLQETLNDDPKLMQEGDTVLMTECPMGGCLSLEEPDAGCSCSNGNISEVLVDFAVAYRKLVGEDNFKAEVKAHNNDRLIKPWYFNESKYRAKFNDFKERSRFSRF